MVVVEVDVDPNVQLTLIGLYCHQESCTEKEFLPLLEEMIKHMKERKDKTGKDFNIMGDLNLSILPDQGWKAEHVNNETKAQNEKFEEILMEYGLYQHVKEATRHPKILDLSIGTVSRFVKAFPFESYIHAFPNKPKFLPSFLKQARLDHSLCIGCLNVNWIQHSKKLLEIYF